MKLRAVAFLAMDLPRLDLHHPQSPRCLPRASGENIVVGSFRWNAATYTIANEPVGESHSCFVLPEEQLVGFVDYGAVDHTRHRRKPQAIRERFELKDALVDSIVLGQWAGDDHEQVSKPPPRDLDKLVAGALDELQARELASCLFLRLRNDALEACWLGTCGFLIIRGSEVVYSSRDSARSVLEESLTISEPSSLPRRKALKYRELSVQPWDLIVAGSDGFFSSLSPEQVLAFLRPTPSGAYDRTLSVANATCLASWTTDDPEFQSYMMAHLALNFTDSSPVPPDLITVAVASIEGTSKQ